MQKRVEVHDAQPGRLRQQLEKAREPVAVELGRIRHEGTTGEQFGKAVSIGDGWFGTVEHVAAESTYRRLSCDQSGVQPGSGRISSETLTTRSSSIHAQPISIG
jgi:hypothetical protein